MVKELTLPKNLIQATMQVVSCRTRLIMELGCLSENQKRAAIDDMICRQMRALEMDNEINRELDILLRSHVLD